MIYVGNRPARFQVGDEVLGRVTYSNDRYMAGADTRGRIIAFVNNDPMMLDVGHVQVMTPTGNSVWIVATKLIRTRGEVEHPAIRLEPVTQWKIVCGCGETIIADTDREVKELHRHHGNRA